MDHSDRIKLFAVAQLTLNKLQRWRVEPIVVRQPPMYLTLRIYQNRQNRHSPKPRVLKEERSKLAEAQSADKALRPIFAWAEKRECRLYGKPWKPFESWVKHYLLQYGLLSKSIWIGKDEQPIAVIVVPIEMRMTIVQPFHVAYWHCGHTMTWSQLQNDFIGKVATKKFSSRLSC